MASDPMRFEESPPHARRRRRTMTGALAAFMLLPLGVVALIFYTWPPAPDTDWPFLVIALYVFAIGATWLRTRPLSIALEDGRLRITEWAPRKIRFADIATVRFERHDGGAVTMALYGTGVRPLAVMSHIERGGQLIDELKTRLANRTFIEEQA